MHRLLICALAITAGCYRPRLEGACQVSCDRATAPACPAGLSCGTDGLCYDDVECSLIDAGTDDGGRDAPPYDTPNITPDCVQTLLLGNVCPSTFLATYVFSVSLDTDTTSTCTEVLTLPSGPVCLIAAENIILNTAIVRVTGSRPLALFGRSSIVINTGVLDLSAGGAGMTDACASPNGANQVLASDAAGGGAGGTMVARGGDGGIPTGSLGVLAPVPSPITTLRGGCSGGRGGNNENGSGGGIGGFGGGAVQLMSPNDVQIAGTINAYGGGGQGGVANFQAAGGGGGGSGGIIAIDAARIEVKTSAVLRAHGGGGGGGSAGSQTGGPGDPATRTDGQSALGGGGMGGANNGSGGFGSSDSSKAGGKGGDTLAAGAGAGGGGGAAGAILLRGGTLTIEIGAKIHPLNAAMP